MYAGVDAALIRISTHPDLVNWSDWPDLNDSPVDLVHGWQAWLRRVWAQPAFEAAITFASPDLTARVNAVLANRELHPRQVRRCVTAVTQYLLRARGRATPFGLFAGVAPVQFEQALSVSTGTEHRVTARVDALWLHDILRQLERDDALRDRLMVQVAGWRTSRNGYLIIGLRPAQHPLDEDVTPADVAIRDTAATQAIVRAARNPIRFRDLVAALAAEFPNKPSAAIRQVLGELLDQQVLISGLRPPMTATDPLGHVLDILTAAQATEVPTVAPLVRILHDIQQRLAAHHHTTDPALANMLRHDASRIMRDICPGAPTLALDQHADIRVALPRTVLDTAARAANALRRLASQPHGGHRWLDYHRRFLERYGLGATVPVQDVLNHDTGLGLPAGYLGSLLSTPGPAVSDRDTSLLRIAQTAALDRTIEVTLDDATITALEVPDLRDTQNSPHGELAVQVHAPDLAALADGRFDLVVTAAYRAAGTTTGRFVDMLDTADRDRIARAYRDLPAANAGARRVQLSCPPLYASTEDISRSPSVLVDLLAINELHVGTATTRLEDLAVRADSHRLYLWSLSTSEPVEPELFSGVELVRHVPPILRFLCEISGALTVHPGPFAWGAAAHLPFLPRLRYGQAILSPARWTLTSHDLPVGELWPDWSAALDIWQQRMMLPRHVDVGATDQRLRLDLTEPAHRRLLSAQLRRHDHLTLHEAPEPDDLGWNGGLAHEIIIPVANRAPAAWPAVSHRPVTTVTTPNHAHLPGAGAWLMAKIYGHPDRHSAMLARLPDLFADQENPPAHWFLPYRDDEGGHHLRLRLQVPIPAARQHALDRLGHWADRLRQLGLLRDLALDTYHPEIGRFGSDTVLAAAHTVFVADSAAALLHRSMHPSHDEARALTAASMLDISIGFSGSTEDGRRWLITHPAARPANHVDRTLYNRALHLADPHDAHAALRALPEGEQLLDSWARRRAALADYRAALDSPGSPAPDTVLAALLHLHSIRVMGLDRTAEQSCYRLACAAALSHTARARAEVSR